MTIATRHASDANAPRPRSGETQAARLLLAFVAGVVCGVWYAVLHAHGEASDFDVFWTAARHAGAPYDPAIVAQLKAALHVQGPWPFVYPPTFLLLVSPFAQLPLWLAAPLWTGLTAALFFFAAAQKVRPAWATMALVVAPAVAFSVAPAQTSLLIGAALIAGFVVRERRPALAGVLFALAAAIKPQAMILAPVVLWGDWRTLRWAASAGAGLVLASLVFGPALWPQWLTAMSDFAAVMPTTNRINPSALIEGPLWAAALAFLGLCLALRSRDIVGLVGGGLCLTPYAHQYDLAPLAPAALAWLIDARRSGYERAATGAALLGGLIATPAAALAFVAALAVFAAPPAPRPAWEPRPGDESERVLLSGPAPR